MKTVSDPAKLEQLVARLNALAPDTPRRWGTLTVGEMLCHLADATASVMDPASSEVDRQRPIIKWIALSSPLPTIETKRNESDDSPDQNLEV